MRRQRRVLARPRCLNRPTPSPLCVGRMIAFNISTAGLLFSLTWNEIPISRDEASVYGPSGTTVHGLHARSADGSASWVIATPSGWANASFDDISSSLVSKNATAAVVRHETDALLVEDTLAFGEDSVDWSFDVGRPRGHLEISFSRRDAKPVVADSAAFGGSRRRRGAARG